MLPFDVEALTDACIAAERAAGGKPDEPSLRAIVGRELERIQDLVKGIETSEPDARCSGYWSIVCTVEHEESGRPSRQGAGGNPVAYQGYHPEVIIIRRPVRAGSSFCFTYDNCQYCFNYECVRD